MNSIAQIDTYQDDQEAHSRIVDIEEIALEQRVYKYSKLSLNIIPLSYGSKEPDGLRWKQVGRSFNPWHDYPDTTERVFTGQYNTAVICGITSKNLIVFDFDTEELADKAYTYCKENHPTTYAVITRRGKHIYIHCTDSSIPSQKFGNVDIKAHGGYVIGAGSVFIDGNGKHHSYKEHSDNTGTIPTLTPEELTAFIFAVTGYTLKRTATRSARSNTERYDVDTLDYLQHGHNTQEGERNDSLVNACRMMLAFGDDPTYIYNALSPIGIASGLTHNEVDKSLHSTIKSYDASRMSDGKQHKRDNTTKLAEQFMNTYAFQSATTKAVLKACITMSYRERGKPYFRVASRELAELAHIGNGTVSRHLKILRDIGILNIRTNQVDGTNYAQWDRDNLITDAVPISKKSVENGTIGLRPRLEDSIVPISTTLLERSAMGHKTTELYTELLKYEAFTMSQIAKHFNITYQSARYHVSKLVENNLIQKEGKHYTAVVNDIALAELTERGQDSAERRKRRHTDEQFKARVYIIIEHQEQKRKQLRQQARQVKPDVVEAEPQAHPVKVDYDQELINIMVELGGQLEEMPQPYTNENIIPKRQLTLFDTRPAYTL
jgi:DNA-binding MarR family transcriptional regulator